ncbi:ParB N-terminal domain-containing protein [Shouchella miscanthi]|uniref:ParB N-terminal domain-containing protein n=1 Tax=Shouchella miscanthi TaxID=2598861 RepID=A0ABU6NRC4_9BACI|nr:ParB N-terminal domain-containing protein [Shouchella miscanthi]
MNKVIFVSFDKLLFHEILDLKRLDRVKNSLSEEKVLREIPVAIERYGKYLILDGAHRTHALFELGIGSIPIQIVEKHEEEKITIGTWKHSIKNEKVIQELKKVCLQNKVHSKEQINIATIYTKNSVVKFDCINNSLSTKVKIMHDLYNTYVNSETEIRRLSSFTKSMQTEMVGNEAVIEYYIFSLTDIFQLADNNLLLPSGVTRINVPNKLDQANLNISIKHLSYN